LFEVVAVTIANAVSMLAFLHCTASSGAFLRIGLNFQRLSTT
jgi:hypothetical protein